MDKNGPKTSKMIENCKLEPLKSFLSLNLELDNFGQILTIFDPQSPNILKTVTDKNVSYARCQLYKQLIKQHLRSSNVPHVREGAIFWNIPLFSLFWTIFYLFCPFLIPKHIYFENCGWKSFIMSGSNFVNNLSVIEEVQMPDRSKKMRFLKISIIFAVFWPFLSIFDPQSPNILKTVVEKRLLGRVPTL